MSKKKSANDLNSFFDNLSDQMLLKESDRGCVLVGAAILDECLEMVLRKSFSSEDEVIKKSVNPLFSVMGPLASFWAKNQLLYALGLINKDIYGDLEIIRSIRNMFAHQYKPVDFLDPEVGKMVEGLICIKKYPMKITRYNIINEDPTDTSRPSDHVMQEKGWIKVTRAHFTYAVSLIRFELLKVISKGLRDALRLFKSKEHRLPPEREKEVTDLGYRKRRNSNTWHWCKNCSNYPAKKFEERHTKPTSGELCNECLSKDRNQKCRK